MCCAIAGPSGVHPPITFRTSRVQLAKLRLDLIAVSLGMPLINGADPSRTVRFR